jgi:lysophospholipase L1-like esterase
VTTNALGLRGPELARERDGRARVLVLGDSFAYGVGVADGETFSARLAARDPGLELLNAGVNGYGTGQELLLLRELGPGLAPDLVLLAFFWNDVPDGWEKRFPRFRLEDGRLLEPLPREPEARPAADWPDPSRPPRFQDSRARRFLKDRAYKARWRLRVALGIPVESPSDLTPDQRAQAFELCFALLREMQAEARRGGARFAIALIPDQVQVYPELIGRVLGIDPADYEVQAPLAAFARAESIPLLDLLPALRAARAAEPDVPLYYRMDRHLTAAGHAVVADALHAWLRGELGIRAR